jgi:hypothetical protein
MDTVEEVRLLIMSGLPDPPHRENRRFVRVLFALILVAGCRSRVLTVKPSIEVTRIPVASIGGPDEMDDIEGRVRNAKPGQQIVIYAHSGVWWIQPFINQPFTRIQSDGAWKSSTHLGTEYAALLVDDGYRPASKIVALPPEATGVAALTVARGNAGTPNSGAVIHFSGYDWNVRTSESDHGGEPNAYDSANAWTDEKGYLHLRMAPRNGRWTCAEVSLTRSLGYGTYKFFVQDSAHLSPSAVLGFFTWDDTHSEGFHNELDIELSRWGDPKEKNAQYVIQPFYVPANFFRFNVPPGVSTYQLRWEPGTAAFTTFADTTSGPGEKTVAEHLFTSGVPIPASETVRIDLYDFHHAESQSQTPAEVVIQKFEYVR